MEPVHALAVALTGDGRDRRLPFPSSGDAPAGGDRPDAASSPGGGSREARPGPASGTVAGGEDGPAGRTYVPGDATGRILFGTSSWSDPSWKGVFYPRGLRPGAFLTHYARHYRTVEADVTYYRIPSPQMTGAWARKVPEGFILAAKFPRSVVHGGTGARPDPERVLVPEIVGADVDAFLDAMARLESRRGPLVLQFPYFNRAAFPEAGPFLERLDRFLAALPDDFRYAVEIRNRSWFGRDLLEVMRRHRCAPVLVDLAYMPHPASLASRLDLVTTDFVYVRLIGDRKEVEEKTETFDRLVVDRTDRLRRWADLLRSLRDRVGRVLVYANNHYAGHAPGTLNQLAELLAEGDSPGETAIMPGS